MNTAISVYLFKAFETTLVVLVHHCNEKVIIFMKFSLMDALEVVIVVKMTFSFSNILIVAHKDI